MPSRQSVTRRRKEANAALNTALVEVAGLVGVSVDPIAVSGPASRDPELREALSAEQAILTLTAIATALQASDKPDALAALRQQIHDELVASITATDGDEAESFDIDVVAAYEAYIADERATGPDDQFAFQDAVLGAFGVSMDGPDDVETGEDADKPESGEPTDDQANRLNDFATKLGALHNLPPEVALERLASAVNGDVEAVESLGIKINGDGTPESRLSALLSHDVAAPPAEPEKPAPPKRTRKKADS